MRWIMTILILGILAFGSLIALGEEGSIAGAERVAVPTSLIRTLIHDVTPEEQRKLLRNEMTRSYLPDSPVFIGYSVDLNEDGEAELVISANNVLYCGSGGCGVWVFQRQNGAFKQLIEAMGSPHISQSKTKGYFDFVAVSNKGALRERGAVYRWQGSAYELRDCFVTIIDSTTGSRKTQPDPCE